MMSCRILLLAVGASGQAMPAAQTVASGKPTYAITDLLGGTPQPQANLQQAAYQSATVAPILDPSAPVAQPSNVGYTSNFQAAGNTGGTAAGSQLPNAGNVGNIMQSLLAGSGVNAGAGQSTGYGAQNQPINGQVLSQDSMQVVSGLIEAFMHKVKLQPGERSCVQRNVGELTGDLMGTVGDIVIAVKGLVEGKGTIKRSQTGGVVSAGIDSAMKITSLVGLSTQLIRNCVHGDALVLMKKVSHHMINGTYLQHRFLVNGIDIANSLADSITAFESHDFHKFGKDIGRTLRKILLSNNNKATSLPEGVPEQVIIQKATDGLMKGFFVSGSAVQITDAAYPDLNIVVNLHRCIAGNSEFFKELWMAAWDLIAQLSMNAHQHGLNMKEFGQMFTGGQQGGGQPKWSGELMIAMMQFPMALQRCGMGQDSQTMLLEAIKSLGDLHVQFKFPHSLNTNPAMQAEKATAKMAKAVKAWTEWDFEKFGYELGELFRDLVMLAFPQKYSVDASGRLQRYSLHAMSAEKKAKAVPGAVLIIGGAAVSLLVSLAVVRTRRASPQLLVDEDSSVPLKNLEDGDALETLE